MRPQDTFCFTGKTVDWVFSQLRFFQRVGGLDSARPGTKRVESKNPDPCKKPQGWGTRDHQQIQHLKFSRACRNLGRTPSAFKGVPTRTSRYPAGLIPWTPPSPSDMGYEEAARRLYLLNCHAHRRGYCGCARNSPRCECGCSLRCPRVWGAGTIASATAPNQH